jgi:hypothetical protein
MMDTEKNTMPPLASLNELAGIKGEGFTLAFVAAFLAGVEAGKQSIQSAA